jgi:hypothetical protein
LLGQCFDLRTGAFHPRAGEYRIDIHTARRLGQLVDVLVEMNLKAIQHYAELGFDGLIFTDDWGLQNRLMIAPADWRKIWKPRYARIFEAAHQAGLHNFLHSCGYIVEILDDLIEIGLEAIHMDQQENMGLELLGKRFGGRLTFFAPVDIQKTMQMEPGGDLPILSGYGEMYRARKVALSRWYTDGKGWSRPGQFGRCAKVFRINQDGCTFQI